MSKELDLLDKLQKSGPECIFMTCEYENSTGVFIYNIMSVIEGKQNKLYSTRNPITAIQELNSCIIKYGNRTHECNSIKKIESAIETIEEYVERMLADKKAEEEKWNAMTKKEVMTKARELGVEFKTAMSKEEIIKKIIER
jgi:glucosamine 6-phosphate synthetase-like amidotransferase/phosphosugar isomerase protein